MQTNFTLYISRSNKIKLKGDRAMPEIYFCIHNLAYGFMLFKKDNGDFSESIKDFELSFEIRMEQNRMKLFGY